MSRHREPQPTPPVTLDELTEWAIEWPWMLGAAWWGFALTAWHSHHHRPAKAHDLPLPAAIEGDREQGLFA